MRKIFKKTTTFILAVLFMSEIITQPLSIHHPTETNVSSVVEAAGPIAPGAPSSLAEWRALSDSQIGYLSSGLSSFDARNYGVVPAIKSQGQTNLCWAYGSTSAIEIGMLKEGFDPKLNTSNLNFYEINAAYRVINKNTNPLPGTTPETFANDKWDTGRVQQNLVNLYTQWRGPVQYSEASDYKYLGDDFTKYLMESAVRLPRAEKGDEATRRLYKEYILKYGAVSVAYHHLPVVSATYWNADGSLNMEHQVAIIGWDDNIPASNFASYSKAASTDGAWLVRDSWGAYAHNNGYFWLSYDSLLRDAMVFDFGPMKYDYNYYYDSDVTGYSAFKKREDQPYIQAANIYKAVMSTPSKQEMLKAINILTFGLDTTVEISIYKGLKNINPYDIYDKSNVPIQGSPYYTQTEKFKNQGVYTIDLKEPVPLDKGEYFSIVVKISNPTNDASLFYSREPENSSNDLSYYYLAKDNKWYNAKINEGVNAVARIKGYTVMETRAEELSKHLNNANIVVSGTSFQYDGKEKTPDVSVSYNGKALIKGTDYLLNYKNNRAPGKASVYVVGLGEFDGQMVESNFMINKAEYPAGGDPKDYLQYTVYRDEATYLKDLPLPYGWEYIHPNTLISSLPIDVETPAEMLYKGGDASYYDNTWGRIWVKVLGEKRTSEMGRLLDAQLSQSSFVYTGEPIRPQVIVKASDNGINNNYEATHRVQYNVSYENNIQPGKAVAVVSGINGYKGSFRVEFNIISNGKISIDGAHLDYQKDGYEYILEPIKPEVQVYLNGNKLTKNKDYSIGYADNEAGGRGKIVVVGMGQYEGTVTGYFNIIDPSMPSTEVLPPVETNDEEGLMETPVPPIPYEPGGQGSGEDPTINPPAKDDQGKGDIDSPISIEPDQDDLSADDEGDDVYEIGSVSLSKTSYTYDGKVKKPSVIVKDTEGDTLSSDSYKVTYQKGRKAVGRYTVKVTMLGNYSGVKTLSFTINPQKTAIKKATGKKKAMELRWTKKSGISGVEIQYSTDNSFKSKNKTYTVKSDKTTKVAIKKLGAKKKYYVRIRTYKTVNGKKYYSEWSGKRTVTTKK